jgi:fused signal recognition particle receptor
MFGFLKDKLKEWVDTAKDKLKAEEKPSEEETSKEIVEEVDVSKPEVVKKGKKEKIEKKGKKAKRKSSSVSLEREDSKVASEEEKAEEETVEAEKSEEEEKAEVEISEKKIEEGEITTVSKGQEEVREVEEALEKKEISTGEAVKEIQEITNKTEKIIGVVESVEAAEPKKGFFKKLFGKKQEKEKEEDKAEPVEEIVDVSSVSRETEDSRIAAEAEGKKKGFFERVKSSLSYKISEEDFNSLFEDLEMLLLENNVALEAVEDIKSILSKKLVGKEISKGELESEIRKELKNTLEEIMVEPEDPLDLIKIKKQEKSEPFVILFFGINGTGKTTSIAKIAHLLKSNNFSVVLAAADTFRAASIEQISIHADKLGVPLVKHDYGADPSAVGFDAIKYAQNHRIDAVLIDTAGRMHTKTNLISEMEKICRVTKPDLKVFVAESIAGNDATEQAKTFNEAIGIDGSILSKADVDEKGGTIISVSHATKKPIIYLGTGQNYEDIKLFDKEDFIKSLGL